MSTPQPQPEAATQTPPASVPSKRVLTLEQEQIVREFETYGLERRQISFDGERPEPIFDFDALSTLSLALTDIPEIRVEPGDFNNIAGIATAICRITLRDGRSREVFGNSLVGEVMHDATEVLDIGQALKIAQARALRNGLRAVGFDPVRAHNQMKQEQQQGTSFADVRSKELAEIHILAADLGYIVGDNKVAYRNLISTHFKGKTSSADLSDLERSQFVSMLRAWKSARERANNSELGQSLLRANP